MGAGRQAQQGRDHPKVVLQASDHGSPSPAPGQLERDRPAQHGRLPRIEAEARRRVVERRILVEQVQHGQRKAKALERTGRRAPTRLGVDGVPGVDLRAGAVLIGRDMVPVKTDTEVPASP